VTAGEVDLHVATAAVDADDSVDDFAISIKPYYACSRARSPTANDTQYI